MNDGQEAIPKFWKKKGPRMHFLRQVGFGLAAAVLPRSFLFVKISRVATTEV